MKPYSLLVFATLVWMNSTCISLAEITTKQIKIGGMTLKLNGSGTRTKAFVHSLYDAGLYLQTPSSDARSIVSGDQLMALRVRIKSGFITREALLESLNEGLVKSTGGNTAAIQKELDQFVATLKDEVKKEDTFDFIYAPAKGLYVMKNGEVKSLIPGLKFKQAFFGIWLSDAPADSRLKQALLAGPSLR